MRTAIGIAFMWLIILYVLSLYDSVRMNKLEARIDALTLQSESRKGR